MRVSTISSWSCLAMVLGAGLSVADAQTITRGFDRTAPATVANEEIVRQPDLWIMEVQLKPMRMVWIDVPNPQEGKPAKEQIWYLAWRAIRRPIEGRLVGDVEPVNQLDPLPGPPQFIPEFTLVTYDNPTTEIPAQNLMDEILPAAMRDLQKVERARHLNSVAVVQDVPDAVAADADEQNWIYGAATWRGVDPETDFFKVILKGFSNGYLKKSADDGTEQVWRKVVVQRFERPGDRYDPDNKEFKYVGNPEWTFQPDAALPATQAQALGAPRK